MAPSHTFVPVEPFTRVSFAAPGSDALVVVEASGLSVDETEMRDDGGGQIEVPVNVDLIASLREHPHIMEKGAAKSEPPTPPREDTGIAPYEPPAEADPAPETPKE